MGWRDDADKLIQELAGKYDRYNDYYPDTCGAAARDHVVDPTHILGDGSVIGECAVCFRIIWLRNIRAEIARTESKLYLHGTRKQKRLARTRQMQRLRYLRSRKPLREAQRKYPELWVGGVPEPEWALQPDPEIPF